MHISTIIYDYSWFKYLAFRTEGGTAITWKHYLIGSTTLGLSLLHGAAFVGAIYVSLEVVFSQYELASPLPICTIIFTALYGLTELFLGVLQCLECIEQDNGGNILQKIRSYAAGDEAAIAKILLFTNRIGMAGMIACAVAGVVEYFNSGTHAPCMLQTLSEKIHLTPETHLAPEVVYGIIAAAVVLLLALYVASVCGRDKTDNDETTVKTTVIGTVKERVMTELTGFVAPCLGG